MVLRLCRDLTLFIMDAEKAGSRGRNCMCVVKGQQGLWETWFERKFGAAFAKLRIPNCSCDQWGSTLSPPPPRSWTHLPRGQWCWLGGLLHFVGRGELLCGLQEWVNMCPWLALHWHGLQGMGYSSDWLSLSPVDDRKPVYIIKNRQACGKI